jgi:hypothetical protein
MKQITGIDDLLWEKALNPRVKEITRVTWHCGCVAYYNSEKELWSQGYVYCKTHNKVTKELAHIQEFFYDEEGP